MAVISEVSKILADEKRMTHAASAIYGAYLESVGRGTEPSSYARANIFRVYLSALHALVGTLWFAAKGVGEANDETYSELLIFFAKMGDKPPRREEKEVIEMGMRLAHVARMSGLSFLDRMDRSTLSSDEQEKKVFDAKDTAEREADFIPFRAAARWLCGELGIDWKTA